MPPPNIALSIVKGIPSVPGDTLSVEHIDDVIDLLDIRGFSVGEAGWIPKLPQVKNNGIYIDSPIVAGHFPVVMTLGDVTENITLTASAASYESRAWMEKQFLAMSRAAMDFWTTDWQSQPVYLAWWANGAPGPQYARIYVINVAQTKDAMTPFNANSFTITIDRELGWSPIPPGDNPKHWSYIAAGTEQTNWTAANAALYTGSGHLVTDTIANRQEFNTLYTFTTRNYVDIPAGSIPGDLPAGVCVAIEINSGNTEHNFTIARSTKPTVISDRAGNALPLYNSFPAAAATLGTNTAFATDATYGVVHNPASALRRIAQTTFANNTEDIRLTWFAQAGAMPHINPTVLRGTYAVFVRAWQSSGAANQCQMRLQIQPPLSGAINPIFNSGQKSVHFYGGGGTDARSMLHYMGMVTLPSNVESTISGRGRGSQVETDLTFVLYAQRLAGTTAVLNVVDVILLPIEEGAVQVTPGVYTGYNPVEHFYDSTGYFTHGKPGDVSAIHKLAGATDDEPVLNVELKGNPIYLQPGVNNRLYILSDQTFSANNLESNGGDVFSVFINIVPRWSNVRDV